MNSSINNESIAISVIVPVYNVSGYLDECVSSLLNQKYQNYEILLIDDGSTDGSSELCDLFSSKSDKVRVIHKKNSGVSSSRNMGVREASGKWVCFVDSDDVVDSSYLSFFDAEPTEKKTLIYHNIIEENEKSGTTKVLYNYYSLRDGKNVDEIVKNNNLLLDGYPFGKLFCKDIIVKYSLWFNENLSMHEDHLFVLNYLSFANNICFTGDANYHYKIRKDYESLSRKCHDSNSMICASEEFIKIVSFLINRFQITNTSEKKRLYTALGLAQLTVAARNASETNYVEVFDYIKSKKRFFVKYYRPENKINWLFYIMAFINLPNGLLFRVKECLTKYK